MFLRPVVVFFCIFTVAVVPAYPNTEDVSTNESFTPSTVKTTPITPIFSFNTTSGSVATSTRDNEKVNFTATIGTTQNATTIFGNTVIVVSPNSTNSTEDGSSTSDGPESTEGNVPLDVTNGTTFPTPTTIGTEIEDRTTATVTTDGVQNRSTALETNGTITPTASSHTTFNPNNVSISSAGTTASPTVDNITVTTVSPETEITGITASNISVDTTVSTASSNETVPIVPPNPSAPTVTTDATTLTTSVSTATDITSASTATTTLADLPPVAPTNGNEPSSSSDTTNQTASGSAIAGPNPSDGDGKNSTELTAASDPTTTTTIEKSDSGGQIGNSTETEVDTTTEEKSSKFPWWIIGVAGGAGLLLIGGALLFFLCKKNKKKPGKGKEKPKTRQTRRTAAAPPPPPLPKAPEVVIETGEMNVAKDERLAPQMEQKVVPPVLVKVDATPSQQPATMPTSPALESSPPKKTTTDRSTTDRSTPTTSEQSLTTDENMTSTGTANTKGGTQPPPVPANEQKEMKLVKYGGEWKSVRQMPSDFSFDVSSTETE